MRCNGNFYYGQSCSDIKLCCEMEPELVPIPITPHKQDPGWKHCQLYKNGQREQLKCIYCDKMFKGGGIYRLKEHLAGRKGQGPICEQVPSDVRILMQQSLDKIVGKQRKKKKTNPELLTNFNSPTSEVDPYDNYTDVNNEFKLVAVPNQVIPPDSTLILSGAEEPGSKSTIRRKRRAVKNLATPVGRVLKVDSPLDSKRNESFIQMAVGRFLYDIGANADAVKSAYFQPMVDAIAAGGLGPLELSYHDLNGWILKDSVEDMKNYIEECKLMWARNGCSILVDQWNTEKGRTLINLLVFCPERTIFLRSVDASQVRYSVDHLYELLKQVVEEVGTEHVVQVITNGDDQYVTAGKKLMETHPHLYWIPCAAHCIDMILEDFGKFEWIRETIEQARCVTKFVYNHSMVLNMMRRFTLGNDIVQPGVARYASNFMTLRRMADYKLNLQTMVTSQEWNDSSYSKQPGGLAMLEIITNRSFWNSCTLISRLTSPLLRLMRTVCGEKRAAMGYVYAGIYRAKEAIKKELVKREDYLVYWNVIDYRWEQQWHLPLHAAGFFLNPKYFYGTEEDIRSEILSGMFDCIERLVPDADVQDKIIKEINLYKNAVGDMGRKMAIRARETLLPAEWWSTYGGGCPNLARLAIRILSQTCSTIGRKRNQIPFEQIYETKNCLERQRLSDLVFLQYNMHLRQMVDQNKEHDSVDQISLSNNSLIEDWIMENEACLEDSAGSDWKSLDQPFANMMILGSLEDESEELGTGFDDLEILNGWKQQQVKEENNNNMIS